MIKTAKIINTRGLKGECKLYSYTDDPAHRFEAGRVLYLDQDRKKPLEIVQSSLSKGLIFVFFKGMDTVEKAEALKGKDLYIPKEDLPETDEDEYYYHELTGCQVYNENQEDPGNRPQPGAAGFQQRRKLPGALCRPVYCFCGQA